MKTSYGLVLSVLVCLPLGRAEASLIFDNFTAPGSFSTRSAGSSPGSLITVSTTTTISNIAVLNNLASAGNLRFLIFDHSTHALLFASAATAFSDDGASATWKMSNTFAFTLVAGKSYDVGAISDVAGLWAFDQVSTSQNGITSNGTFNPNFSNFATPFQSGHAAADGALRLFSEIVEVPVPQGIVLSSVGLVLVFGMSHLRRLRMS